MKTKKEEQSTEVQIKTVNLFHKWTVLIIVKLIDSWVIIFVLYLLTLGIAVWNMASEYEFESFPSVYCLWKNNNKQKCVRVCFGRSCILQCMHTYACMCQDWRCSSAGRWHGCQSTSSWPSRSTDRRQHVQTTTTWQRAVCLLSILSHLIYCHTLTVSIPSSCSCIISCN